MSDSSVCCSIQENEDSKDATPRQTFGNSISDCHKRSLNLLALLSKEHNLEVTFQGLKRKLGWHQEILSRTLRRLQEDKVLLKTSSGAYRLNSDISEFNRSWKDIVLATQLWLPLDLKPSILISKLKNTWFGQLRWYGCSEDGSKKALTWVLEDGSILVKLRIADNVMFIEAGPVASVGRDRCIHAGYKLLNHVMRLYKASLTKSIETPIAVVRD